jgi:hypothetical protein
MDHIYKPCKICEELFLPKSAYNRYCPKCHRKIASQRKVMKTGYRPASKVKRD